MRYIVYLTSVLAFSFTLSAEATLYGRRSLECNLTSGDFDAIDAASPCQNYRALIPQQITFQAPGGRPQTLNVNFGGGDTVASYTNLGAYGDMIELNRREMACRQRVIEDARKSANIGRTTDAALERFKQLRRSVRPRVQEIRDRRDAMSTTLRSGGGDGVDRRAAAMTDAMMNQAPAAQAEAEVTRAFSGVPFGVEVNVLQKLRELNDRFPAEMSAADEAVFRREYELALYGTSVMYAEGQNKLNENARDLFAQTPDGRRLKTGIYYEWNQNLWNSMINFGSADDYVASLRTGSRPISDAVAGRLQ